MQTLLAYPDGCIRGEAAFARARDAEAASEVFLVDDVWKLVKAEPKPVVVVVNSNGANGNGHREEPEPANGQQSLFSWPEFRAEEPARPTGRSGKLKTASPSLFEWALNAERERQKEPLSAGR